MTNQTAVILARLHKAPNSGGGYHLRGRLSDGREIQVSNQRKRRAEDPDFLLVVVTARGEEGEKSQGSEQKRSGHAT